MPEILQSLKDVVVRPALVSDKVAVLQCMPAYLTRYRRLHRLGWDKWMADVSGQILVAAVGIAADWLNINLR